MLEIKDSVLFSIQVWLSDWRVVLEELDCACEVKEDGELIRIYFATKSRCAKRDLIMVALVDLIANSFEVENDMRKFLEEFVMARRKFSPGA